MSVIPALRNVKSSFLCGAYIYIKVPNIRAQVIAVNTVLFLPNIIITNVTKSFFLLLAKKEEVFPIFSWRLGIDGVELLFVWVCAFTVSRSGYSQHAVFRLKSHKDFF